MSLVVGLDGHRNGWVAVATNGGGECEVRSLSEIGELAAVWPNAGVVGVDIPIGLPALANWGTRPCDEQARKMLSPRGSSVFSAPPREVLLENDHASATALSEEHHSRSKGITQQAFNLRHKILEVEAFVAKAEAEVIEVHPEVSFLVMNDWKALGKKKSFGGVARRLQLLQKNGIQYGPEVPDEVAALPPDDVLDAGAVAWSALRHASGKAVPLPERPPEQDGRPVAIWY